MAVTSGIKTVQATIKGQVYTLTLNDTSGKYEATITAPDKSSYNNNAGHYYPVSITATDQAGNSVTIDDTDSTLGNSLKLKVKEKVKPIISKLVPSNGAYLATSAPEITATLTDDDSGIAISTLVLKIDGQTINNTNITKTTTTGGYNISYTPTTALNDGSHTVTVQISDNDGNVSDTASTTFSVMTTAPTLEITAPVDGLNTNKSALTVTGTTNADAKVKITLNGTDVGTVTVDSDGTFSKGITFNTEGENVIVITSTNLAGVDSSVTRKVIYDTTAPSITAATITPNPVDAGNTYVISLSITD